MSVTRRTLIAATGAATVGATVGWEALKLPAGAGSREGASTARTSTWGPSGDPVTYLRALIAFGLGSTPVLGGLISGLFIALFLSDNDPWKQLEEQIRGLIKEEIRGYDRAQRAKTLEGMRDVVALYLKRVQGGASGTEIRHYFSNANAFLTGSIPSFSVPEFAFQNSPLYAIAAHIHLALLRDGVVGGKEWGMSDRDHAVLVDELRAKITAYGEHLDAIVESARKDLARGAPTGDAGHYQALHNHWNDLNRNATVLVSDLRRQFPFTDPTVYPEGIPDGAIEYEDVYSPAFGMAKTWGSRDLAWQVQPVYQKPLADIDRIELTARGDTHTVNVHYPSGKGPLVTRFDRRGAVIPSPRERTDQTRILQPSYTPKEQLRTLSIPRVEGRTFSIESVFVSAGEVVQQCRLTTFDNETIDLWTGGTGHGFTGTYSVPGRALSAITVWQQNRKYGNVPSVLVFSFSHDPEFVVPEVEQMLAVSGTRGSRSLRSTEVSGRRAEFRARVAEIADAAER